MHEIRCITVHLLLLYIFLFHHREPRGKQYSEGNGKRITLKSTY